MCRWMGWTGQSVLVEELLFKPKHGLVDQSLHSRMGVETTNGDGFGLGWYGQGEGPAVYHGVAPAWGDANLRELASHVEARTFLAHVRATTGTAIQQTNCHPFRHGRWLMVHNGVINGFEEMRRELMLAVAPELFAGIKGSTDSEVLFHLALTFGLEDDPAAAMEHAIGLVEATAAAHGIEHAIQASVGVTDGERMWAFRYATDATPRTLFVSAEADAIHGLYPENERLQSLRDEDRIIVSEPLADLPGAWIEIPESTVMLVQPGPDEQRPFRPTQGLAAAGADTGGLATRDFTGSQT
jgi:predicted glutamine amidotransferase